MMADLYSTRRLTRTADEPGLFAVSRHDPQDGYSIRAHAAVTESTAAGSAMPWLPPFHRPGSSHPRRAGLG